jgi:hypothetical protein
MSEKEHPNSKRYPELRRFDSLAEAKAAFAACQKVQMKTPWFWLGLVAYTAAVGLIVSAVLIVLRTWVPLSGGKFAGIVGATTGSSGAFGLRWFWRHRFRKLLRERLVEAGIPICIKCGYDLRGQIEPRCPECGTEFDAALLKTAAPLPDPTSPPQDRH